MQSEIFYLDVVLEAGAHFPLPDNHENLGVSVTEGSVEVAGNNFEAGRMMVFRPGDRSAVKAGPQGVRLMALGGATLNENRYICWNLIWSSRNRIAQVKEDWKAEDWRSGHFRLLPDDDAEFISISLRMERTRPGE